MIGIVGELIARTLVSVSSANRALIEEANMGEQKFVPGFILLLAGLMATSVFAVSIYQFSKMPPSPTETAAATQAYAQKPIAAEK